MSQERRWALNIAFEVIFDASRKPAKLETKHPPLWANFSDGLIGHAAAQTKPGHHDRVGE